jgi:hypothetical protein
MHQELHGTKHAPDSWIVFLDNHMIQTLQTQRPDGTAVPGLRAYPALDQGYFQFS